MKCPSLSIPPGSWNGEVMAGATDTILYDEVSWDNRPCIIEDQVEGVQVITIADSGHLCK